MDKVKHLITQPGAQVADDSARILRDIEVELGCAVALLKNNSTLKRDFEIQSLLRDLQREVAVLAQVFSETDRMLGAWLRTVQSKRGGYNGKGEAAPLVLVSKMSVEG